VARRLAKRALLNSVKNSIDELESLGFLDNSKLNKLHQFFSPWLMSNVIRLISSRQQTAGHLVSLCEKTSDDLLAQHKEFINKEEKRKQDILNDRQHLKGAQDEYKKVKAEWKRKEAIRKSREVLIGTLHLNLLILSENRGHCNSEWDKVRWDFHPGVRGLLPAEKDSSGL